MIAGSLHAADVVAPPAAAGTNTNSSFTAVARPGLIDFVGTWTGKWDGIWAVRFTISPSTRTNEVNVVYEWEENIGQPWRRARHPGRVLDSSLKVGTHMFLELDANDASKARAIGKFAEKRTAELLRQQP